MNKPETEQTNKLNINDNAMKKKSIGKEMSLKIEV